MHNVGGSHAVSIEIALLGGMAGNETYLSFVQDQALASGGRLHWGQANNRLNAQQVVSQYGALLDGGPVSAVAEGGRTHLVFVGSDGGVYSRTRTSSGLWSSIWSFVTTTNLERPWLGVPGGAVHAVSTDPGQLQVLYANASGRVIAVQGENDGAGNQWRTRRNLLAGRTTHDAARPAAPGR